MVVVLTYKDNIDIPEYYKTRSGCELLGFMPALDHERHSYYTVENIHPNAEYLRVSPVFGKFSDTKTDLEYWYEKPPGKGMKEEHRLQHEFYRDEFLERLETHKYCVWFEGCDDGDSFMRFESKEKALEFLEEIELFDEIYEHPLRQMW